MTLRGPVLVGTDLSPAADEALRQGSRRLAQLRELIGEPFMKRLVTVEKRYGTFEEADALAETAKTHGVTDVVAAVGGWWQGKKLWEIDADIRKRYFVEPATTHMALLRALVPALPAAGTYTLITGYSAPRASRLRP